MTDAADRDLGIDGLGPGTVIGQGGSAVVYRVRQDELDRDVAVKVLGGVVDDDTRRRFDRERRLMGRLSQHEGMVTVYQTGFTARDEPFIVMPLLGRSLDDEIKQQPLPWERAAEIVADVCRTVGFAHGQEIVHRDLKPANIMLSTSGRPLVADFGIARIVDTKTNLEATALTLTPAYSPPEALETTVADPSTDVYSLGATLFALIAGHPPYCEPGADTTLMALMRSIFDAPVPQLGEAAPVELQGVLDRSMAKRPDDRYRTAGEMADALEAAVLAARRRADASDTLIVTPPAGDAGPAPSSRRRLIVALVAVVAIVAGIGGIILARSGDDEQSAPVGSEPLTSAPEVVPVDSDEASPPEPAAEPADSVVATTEPVLVVEGGEVFLLPFDEPGPGAFIRTLASTTTAELEAFVLAGGPESESGEESDAGDGPTAVAGIDGTADGVFAGTEGSAPCAPDEVIAGLDAATVELDAWAAIQDIEVADVADYIDGLTAAVLSADTRMTDHRFEDGAAVPFQAVLQVGTAVLVDEFGEPQVRCASGSPLSAPEPVVGTTTYVGPTWDTFQPTGTVAVVASPDPVEEFVLTDVSGGPDFVRPVGTSGASDRPLLPGEILAAGEVTSFPDVTGQAFETNIVEVIFRPEGGEVTGSYEWSLTFNGVLLVSAGDLVGTYDPLTGSISGTGSGTVSGGGGVIGGSGDGAWSATVDPPAGTMSGNFGGEAFFDLTFAPYDPPA